MVKKPEFKKINDYLWEISPSYKQGMKVPVRVYASEKLLNQMDLAVFDQASNVATLPGIQKYSYVMPDGHSGYGFPIGGVAAFDTNEGVISPGGVGFDINCLSGDSEILTRDGYTIKIKDMFEFKEKTRLPVISKKGRENAEILLYMRRKSRNDVFKIQTESGYILKATGDHPIMTKKGMVEINKISEGESVALFPFRGVEYEVPSDEIIFDEKNIMQLEISERTKKQIINELKERDLLSIKYSHEKLPILLRLIGYNTGNGLIYIDKGKDKEKRIYANFYGNKKDLKKIQKDISELGFSSKIYSRKRERKINTKYGTVRFEIIENSLHVSSKTFSYLLALLGAPTGRKSHQDFTIPQWLLKATKWQKRLYLAAFFGAEMNSPKTSTNNGYDSYMPCVSIKKSRNNIQPGIDFLSQISELLKEFGIDSTVTKPVYEYTTNSETYKIKLMINENYENIINLYETIGFEYNEEKTTRANAAIVYLKLKKKIIDSGTNAIENIEIMNRVSSSEILKSESQHTNSILIKRTACKENLRTSFNFETYDEYLAHSMEGLKGGAVWDKIIKIEKIEYDDWVYDFTVNHDSHNFISDCFVVSNCGMRLVKTDLTIKDVKPKIRELIDELFKKVPSGVGATGFVKISKDEFKKVIEEGSKWAVEKGYGWEEDLRRTEENGCMEGADASKISQRAITRGYDQIGTLGSGNHYLEIQVVKEENIYDKEAAKKLGIFPNQIVVMFHCGSRGFGHQVATDSLNTFLNVMESKYKIKILDRELACAPFSSPEGQTYFSAMKGAMNMAFANRQVILHRIREVFSHVFKSDPEKLGMHQIYDVTHNTAKIEKYLIDGNWKEVIVHRKGATRAFGPNNKEIPKEYYELGQPVIIGGSMETGSYLLLGTKGAEENTFGSTAHGSGRTMSRAQAKHQFRGDQLQKEMEKKGIIVRTDSLSGLAEEAGAAYKNIDEVIETCHQAGISKKIVRFLPIANIKG